MCYFFIVVSIHDSIILKGTISLPTLSATSDDTSGGLKSDSSHWITDGFNIGSNHSLEFLPIPNDE